MFNKIAILICLAVSISFSGSMIWKSSEFKVDIDTIYTQKYTGGVELAGSSSFYFITKANDIRDSGFVNDSVKIFTGYRTFTTVTDRLGNSDTLYGSVVWADTCNLIKGSSTNMDTLSVTGFAVRKSPVFTPVVSQYIQGVIKPTTGTRVGKSIGWVVLEIQRAVGTIVSEK
jgi:hypothetical protein